MLNPRFRYYWEGIWGNFKLLRDCLLEITGKGDYLILPYEFLVESPNEFLQKLSYFIEDEGILNSSIQVLNKNSKGVNEWKKKKQKLYIKPFKLFNKYDTRVISFEFGKQKTIRLTPQISEKVQDFFQESNQLLDQEEKLDLEKYGYYINNDKTLN